VMSTAFQIIAALIAVVGAFFVFRFLRSKGLLTDVLAVIGVGIAIYIPEQIDESAREVQKLTNCVNTTLEFRQNILQYYQLDSDDFGNIKEPSTNNGNATEFRVRVQNAKDSTYTLCNGVTVAGKLLLDPNTSPWKEAPTSATANWSKGNVSDLYAWSTDTLRSSTQVESRWMHIPGTTIPILPRLEF
jgi:hypothetical protein